MTPVGGSLTQSRIIGFEIVDLVMDVAHDARRTSTSGATVVSLGNLFLPPIIEGWRMG